MGEDFAYHRTTLGKDKISRLTPSWQILRCNGQYDAGAQPNAEYQSTPHVIPQEYPRPCCDGPSDKQSDFLT
jgi:hypothetical protein